MSKAFKLAAAEIADTAHSNAVEYAMWAIDKRMKPKDVLACVGLGDAWDDPSWEDAIYGLTYAHKRLSDRSLPKFSPVKPKTKSQATAAPLSPRQVLARKLTHTAPTALPVGPFIDTGKLERMRTAGR